MIEGWNQGTDQGTENILAMSQLSPGANTLRRRKAQGQRDSGARRTPALALNWPEACSLLGACQGLRV